MPDPTLRIISVYEALDGEANAWHQGTWTVFVRTSGCAVGCRWCDTMYSWSPKRGRDYTPIDLIGEVAKVSSARKITLTGGEPLEQDVTAVALFLNLAVQRGYKITIETAGSEPVAWLKNKDPNIALVLDYKCSSSQITKPMVEDNFVGLDARHVVKFVVYNELDYREAISAATWMRKKGSAARLVLSPLMPVGKFKPIYSLAQWVEKMKKDQLASLGLGLNLQLHKIIYPADAREEEEGGVDYTGVHK